MKINNINNYKSSIRDSNFTREEESTIWDFYVTKSISHSASQHRDLEIYNPPSFTNNFSLLSRMMRMAHITEKQCIILFGSSISKALSQLELQAEDDNNIDIITPRIACLINSDNQNSYKQPSEKSRVINIMNHTRNAFAHGNTFFFDNGFIMLEDNDNYNKIITARMIFHKNTLLSWIRLFDKEKYFYPEIHI